MMPRSCAAALLALSLLLPGQSSAFAAKRAFVLGIDAYDKVPKLSKAVNDGKAIAQLLQELQFEVMSLSNASKAAFQQSWGDFLNALKEGDTILFYFAGHGVQLEGLNYLLVKDTSDGAKGDDAVRMENIAFHDLLAQVEARKPKASFYILDACRDNPFGGKAKGKALGQARGLARLESVFGTFVMYSAGPDEQALDSLTASDKESNSVYTRRLLPLLRDKELSLVDVAKRIQVQVEQDARTKGGHQQRPAYFDGILGHYNLATDTHASGSLLFTSQEEWRRNPRVMWIDLRSHWDQDCNPLTPPKITVVTPPKYGRIVTRTTDATVTRPSPVDSIPTRCMGKPTRGWGVYYVMDEEHLDKKAVDSARIKVYYFLAPKKPTLTIDYSIDPATRSRTFTYVK
jgi:hypothetical protein